MVARHGKEILPIGLLLLLFIVTAGAYSELPNLVAFHFNFDGVPDGFVDKAYGLTLIPLASVILYMVLYSLPFFDTKERNVRRVWKYIYSLKILSILALFMVQLFIISYNSEFQFLPQKFTMLINLVISLSIMNLAFITYTVKRNFLIGVRTPYTLANNKIWDKSNRLGGKLLAIHAFILLVVSVLFEAFFLHFLIAGVVLIAFITFFYSLRLYKHHLIGF